MRADHHDSVGHHSPNYITPCKVITGHHDSVGHHLPNYITPCKVITGHHDSVGHHSPNYITPCKVITGHVDRAQAYLFMVLINFVLFVSYALLSFLKSFPPLFPYLKKMISIFLFDDRPIC